MSGQENIQLKTGEGVTYFADWAANITYIDMYTTVDGLPDGTYEVSLKVKASKGADAGTSYVYATSSSATKTTTVTTPEAWETLTVACPVTGGTLRLGLYSKDGWYGRIANVSLRKVSDTAVAIQSVGALTGQCLTPRPGTLYDLAGRAVRRASRGIYISGGKKIAIR